MNYNPIPIPFTNDINYILEDLSNRIKKLELRIQKLESISNENNSNYIEPDKEMYMI